MGVFWIGILYSHITREKEKINQFFNMIYNWLLKHNNFKEKMCNEWYIFS